MWLPDRTLNKAVYRQIAERFEKQIRSGSYPAGSLLPAERKLASELSVNRSTIIQAYEELRAQGLVIRTPGSGTRVASMSVSGVAPDWRRFLEGGTLLPNISAMRRIRTELRRDQELIDFASGELSDDMFPSGIIREICQERPYEGKLGYDDPQGYGPFREELAGFLRRRLQIETSASSILVTSGSQQSLFLLLHGLLRPGDAVAIEDPSYCHSLSLFQSAGLRVHHLAVDQDGVNPDDVAELHRKQRLSMIFLNPNYQNPTGSVLSAERRRKLLEIAAQRGIPIVEDDPFSLTAFDGKPPLPLKADDPNGQILYVGSLSKIAASGLRVGWLIGPPQIIARLADIRQQMDFGMSAIPQWLAMELLKESLFEPHIRKLRLNLSYKLDRLRASLDAHLPGLVSFKPPDGGLNLWAKWKGAGSLDDIRTLERAINEGAAYVPGHVFGTSSGYIRLCFAKPREDLIDTGVVRLRRAWLGE